MTDAYGVYSGERIMAGVVTEYLELCFLIKEAKSRIIPYITIACQKEIKRVVVMSNDADLVIYSLAYHQRFCELGIQEFLVKFGIKDGRRNISIHLLGQHLGGE